LNILVIDEEFPFPLNTGKRIRTFNLTKGLTLFHDVSYLAYGEPDSPGYDFLKDNGISPYAVDSPDRRQAGIRFYLRLLLNLTSPYPYIVTSHHTEAFQSRLKQLIDRQKFDLVVCEWTPYALFLRELRGVKSVIVAHNIESAIWKRYEENEKNPFKKWYILVQKAKVEKFERNCFRWANGATAVSEPEAEQIQRFGLPHSVEVIENGVDLNYFTPCEAKIDPNMLVFTGSMDWRPNQDAALHFVHAIFPLIHRKNPQATVTLVGRKPPKKIAELENIEGVTVTGTVDDVRPYIAQAALYIVPLRIGGGSRLKILEAMAMKKGVVSTSIGAEGLRVTNGENILLGDNPEEFAEKVLTCLGDQTLRTQLAEQGRKLVEQHYGWEGLSKRYNNYLVSVVEGR